MMSKCDEKEKLATRTLLEFTQLTDTCDAFERQTTKLQEELSSTLDKLDEMSREAERCAQEADSVHKQLAVSEQKREEFKIQAQETVQQCDVSHANVAVERTFDFHFRWKSKVKKLEKDVDRHKFSSSQTLERNEQHVRMNDESDGTSSCRGVAARRTRSTTRLSISDECTSTGRTLPTDRGRCKPVERHGTTCSSLVVCLDRSIA
jgi:chromosome segregation ATPase